MEKHLRTQTAFKTSTANPARYDLSRDSSSLTRDTPAATEYLQDGCKPFPRLNTYLRNLLVYSPTAILLRNSLLNAFIQYSSKEEPSKKNNKEEFLGFIASEWTPGPSKPSPASSFVSCVNSYHLAHRYRFSALSPSTAQPIPTSWAAQPPHHSAAPELTWSDPLHG